jgi:hypothetical protein
MNKTNISQHLRRSCSSSAIAMAFAVWIVAIVSFSFSAFGQLDTDRWTQIGNGIISTSIGPTEGTHNRSGKAIQASWTSDAEQGRHVLWVGTQYGGLWKSIVDTDGNIQSWLPLTDNFPGPHGMASFLVNQADSQLILVGSAAGEGDGSIYLTHTQGGQWTAQHLPVDAGEKHVTTVRRIRGDRSDPNIVIACTDRGIYRSHDFGLNWHRKFKSIQGHAVPVFDAVQDVGDAQIWYAAAAVDGVILRSTDNGMTWQRYSSCPGCIPGPAKRVSLATCDADSSILFALVVNEPTDPDEKDSFDGLYRSTTRGRTWVKIFWDAEAVDHAGQGGSNNAVACDPSNPNHVIFGCKDQLETFTALLPPDLIHWNGYHQGERSNLDLGHGDLNYLLFRPGFQSVVVCNDGGYYIYHPATGEVDDSGNLLGINALWVTKPQGCLTASRTNTDRFIAGLQDNGVIRGDVAANELILIHGSDGGRGSIMPDNDDVMTASATAGQRSESFNSGNAWFDINYDLDTESFPSIQIDPTPGIESPHIFTHSHDTLGLSRIYFRPVFEPFVAWERASHHVLNGVITHLDHTTNHASHEILCTREDRRSLFAYMGARGQLGNLDLVDITPPLPELTNGVKDARANADKSGLQPDTIYYTTGSSRPSKAFISTNGGSAWTDVTYDMPSDLSFNKLIGNPRNPLELFLATNQGVYRCDFNFINGFHWVPYSTGLRINEDVLDIVINIHGLDQPTLYVATKGRGFWKRTVQ